jgi:hypothetical protein
LHRAARRLAEKPTEKVRGQAAALLAELGPLEEYQAIRVHV